MPDREPAYRRGAYNTRPERRFWAKVDRRDSDVCWPWTGCQWSTGYGNLSVGGRGTRAHRFSYELHHGPIPEGLVIDHLCRNRLCVNPAHLRACTHRENVLAPGAQGAAALGQHVTHCPHGHDYDDANTHINTRGARVCRVCARRRAMERYWRLKGR